MSGKLMHAVLSDGSLNFRDKLILLVIADRADNNGTDARPGMGELARVARCTERTVNRRLGRLEAEGRFTRVRQRSPRGRLGFWVYTLNQETSMVSGGEHRDQETSMVSGGEHGDQETSMVSGGEHRDQETFQGGSHRTSMDVRSQRPVNVHTSGRGAPAVAARTTRAKKVEGAGQPDPVLVGELVGLYRERCAALGSPPLERDVTRVAGQVRELMGAGKPRPVIEVGIERAAQRNLPGLLTRFVGDIEREAAGNGTGPLHRRPTAGDQLPERMARIEAARREGRA